MPPGTPKRPAKAAHVAIVRLTSLGDVIHTLPVAAAIRRHNPDARITWLVEEREQIILRGNPVVDEVIVVPLRRWRSQWSEAITGIRALSRRLREEPIDVAIDVQGWAHKTSPLMLLTRAPLRIGFDRRHSRDGISPFATNRHITPPDTAPHIVDQNLCLLEPLGIGRTEAAEFPLPSFPDSRERADLWRRSLGSSDRDRLIVLFPSTRGEPKRWPAESFRELGRRLLDDPRVRLLVLGGPGEEALLEDVRRGLPPERAHTWTPGPIPDLTEAIRGAQLAVGNDTGPLHIAAALNVRSFGLFGPTQGARNGPYGAHCGYVQSPTGKIVDITVDDVMRKIAVEKQNT
jgi:lipopolysaccharide heptosyltransferase I